MTLMRVIAVDARGGGVLDWDVPAENVSLTRSLNTSAMVGLTVPAWYHGRTDANGHPILLKGGTILVVEEDDGRLTPALMSDESLADDFQADGLGLSVLSKDAPWEWDERAWSGTDVLAVWRLIWGRIIAGAGVPRLRLEGPTSVGVTVGKAPSARWSTVLQEMQAAQATIDRRDARIEYWEKEVARRALVLAKRGGRSGVGEITSSSSVPEVSEGASYKMHIYLNADGEVLRVYHWMWEKDGTGRWYYRSDAPSRQAGKDYLAAKNTRDSANSWFQTQQTFIEEKQAWMDANPDQGPEHYTLSRWANRDLSADLEHLRDLAGFDWWETAEWDDQDRLVPVIRVSTAKPVVRDDLHFELGVNIHAHPELTRGEIVTQVTVTGAGEGDSTLTADRAWSHPRLVRRSRTVSESDLGTQQLVNRAADREVAKARAAMEWQFTSLVVTDSPTARISQIDLGNIIRITGTLADDTDLDQTVRVMEITRTWDGSNPGSSIEIEVEPA